MLERRCRARELLVGESLGIDLRLHRARNSARRGSRRAAKIASTAAIELGAERQRRARRDPPRDARCCACRGSARHGRRAPAPRRARAARGSAELAPPARRTRSTAARLCRRLSPVKRGIVRADVARRHRRRRAPRPPAARARPARRRRSRCRARGRSRAPRSRDCARRGEYSLCTAAIGWTACARRIVAADISRQADRADLARLLRADQRADRLLDRHASGRAGGDSRGRYDRCRAARAIPRAFVRSPRASRRALACRRRMSSTHLLASVNSPRRCITAWPISRSFSPAP